MFRNKIESVEQVSELAKGAAGSVRRGSRTWQGTAGSVGRRGRSLAGRGRKCRAESQRWQGGARTHFLTDSRTRAHPETYNFDTQESQRPIQNTFFALSMDTPMYTLGARNKLGLWGASP